MWPMLVIVLLSIIVAEGIYPEISQSNCTNSTVACYPNADMLAKCLECANTEDCTATCNCIELVYDLLDDHTAKATDKTTIVTYVSLTVEECKISCGRLTLQADGNRSCLGFYMRGIDCKAFVSNVTNYLFDSAYVESAVGIQLYRVIGECVATETARATNLDASIFPVTPESSTLPTSTHLFYGSSELFNPTDQAFRQMSSTPALPTATYRTITQYPPASSSISDITPSVIMTTGNTDTTVSTVLPVSVSSWSRPGTTTSSPAGISSWSSPSSTIFIEKSLSPTSASTISVVSAFPSVTYNCPCEMISPYVNMTEEERLVAIQQKVTELIRNLTVSKKELSSTLRQKTSADDKRVSAMAVGYVLGTALLTFSFGIIVLIDAPILMTQAMGLIKWIRSDEL